MTVGEIEVPYKPCHCDMLGGEPHRPGPYIVIPWDTFIKAFNGRPTTVAHKDTVPTVGQPYYCKRCKSEFETNPPDPGCPTCGETATPFQEIDQHEA